MKQRSQDILAGGVILAINLIVFGYHSGRLGFYADDPGFLIGIYPGMSFQQLVSAISSYVTGRNLHMLWQYLVAVIAGGSGIENLPTMHYVQVAADAVASVLFFVVLRLWRVALPAAFVAAAGFSFYPIHDETHYWLSALPMNIMSTIFVLLLLCQTSLVLRALSETDRSPVQLVAQCVLYLLVFLCSMFTYDQTVPVTMVVVTLTAGTIFYLHPKARLAAAGAWCFCLAVFVALVIWKVHVPAGGPVFSNLTVSHVLQNLRVSVNMWLSLFNAHALLHPLRFATMIEQFMAAAIAVVVVGVTWLFFESRDGDIADRVDGASRAHAGDGGGLAFNLAMMAVGIAFYLLAYLPAYLWYLSPRHSYFPSVGVAMIVAGIFGAFIPLMKRVVLLKAVVVLFTGVLLTSFVCKNLSDKDLWVTAYEMRKTMYQDVASRYASRNPTAFLLSGFPSSIAVDGSALGFLSGENAVAPSIMTSGKIVADAISIHPVPSRSGYFIKTEEGRWGDAPFVHVARDHASVVLFESINEGQLKAFYDVGQDRLRPSEFYSLKPIASASAEPEFSARTSAEGYDIEIPAVVLNQNEVVAVVAYTATSGRKPAATHSTKADMEAYAVPVDVSDSRDGAAHAFHLDYQVSMTPIDGFRLYRIDGSRAEAIAEVPVK